MIQLSSQSSNSASTRCSALHLSTTLLTRHQAWLISKAKASISFILRKTTLMQPVLLALLYQPHLQCLGIGSRQRACEAACSSVGLTPCKSFPLPASCETQKAGYPGSSVTLMKKEKTQKQGMCPENNLHGDSLGAEADPEKRSLIQRETHCETVNEREAPPRIQVAPEWSRQTNDEQGTLQGRKPIQVPC